MTAPFTLNIIIGQGSFGKVYKGKFNQMDVAIKIGKRNSLYFENIILRSHIVGSGIPKVYKYGRIDEMDYMIMELLGNSLDKLLNDGKISSKNTIYNIGLQILQRLQLIHTKGFVYKDIKLENITIGINDPRLIYLIDFGTTCKISSVKSTKTGNARFASLGVHKSNPYSIKDDLYSLGYLLIYLLERSLPWMNIDFGEKDLWDELGKIKEETTYRDLTSDEVIIKYVDYITKTNDIDYNTMMEFFSDNIDNNLKLDWE